MLIIIDPPAASIHVQADNETRDKEALAMNHRIVTAVNSNLNNDAGNTLGGEKCQIKEVSINAMKCR